MNKFSDMLSASNTDIKTARAQALAESTVLEVEAFISSLKRERNVLNTKLTNLTDLAPDNTYSLRPGSKDFDAARWVKELHTTRMDLSLLDIKIKEADAIFNEWFKVTEPAA